MQNNLINKEQIYYVMSFSMFSEYDMEILCSYKQFVQNTIIQLGEDWRIQSGLLSQQIIGILNQNMTAQPEQISSKMQFNIFNEFLLPFLKQKIGKEKQVCNMTDSTIQETYSNQIHKYFPTHSKITGSLTFKTLSLGFCIKAVDVWVKVFSNVNQNDKQQLILSPIGILQKQFFVKQNSMKFGEKSSIGASTIRQNFSNMDLGSCQQSNSQINEKKNNLFEKKWKFLEDLSVFQESQIKGIQHSLKKAKSKKNQIISYFIVNVHQLNTSQQNQVKSKKVRVLSINNQFYRNAFIVWLIFNIKLFFSISFEQYLMYFKNVVQNWEPNYEAALKKFYIIIQKQWNLLLKDYSVALHDDYQVLKNLINRVRTEYSKNWEIKQEEIWKKLMN